jgi:hypothetical protein
LPKELPDCYLSHDLSSPRSHFPAIIRPSSFVAEPLLHSGSSSSPAIAVNPQANLLSISICRVAGQLNIRALACSTYAYPGFPSLLFSCFCQDACDAIGFACPFLSSFFN